MQNETFRARLMHKPLPVAPTPMSRSTSVAILSMCRLNRETRVYTCVSVFVSCLRDTKRFMFRKEWIP